ncbi:MAG: hypothetical protein ACFE8N_07755 [Promethearchaeota archaeon]
MAEEPQLPPIPDIGEIIDRKKRLVEQKQSVIKCSACEDDFSRVFKEGDFVFKKILDEKCKKCNKSGSLTIVEIYSEWIDPKKKK